MPEDYLERVRLLPPAKALAIGLYGESVASYRYRVLAEKATTESHRHVFLEMADEEQTHHQVLQQLMDQHFPDSDFVLSPQDKEFIIIGQRMIEVTDGPSIDRALELIHDSERLTGRFYAALHETFALSELRPLMHDMAEECFEHAQRLKDLGSSSSTAKEGKGRRD